MQARDGGSPGHLPVVSGVSWHLALRGDYWVSDHLRWSTVRAGTTHTTARVWKFSFCRLFSQQMSEDLGKGLSFLAPGRTSRKSAQQDTTSSMAHKPWWDFLAGRFRQPGDFSICHQQDMVFEGKNLPPAPCFFVLLFPEQKTFKLYGYFLAKQQGTSVQLAPANLVKERWFWATGKEGSWVWVVREAGEAWGDTWESWSRVPVCWWCSKPAYCISPELSSDGVLVFCAADRRVTSHKAWRRGGCKGGWQRWGGWTRVLPCGSSIVQAAS